MGNKLAGIVSSKASDVYTGDPCSNFNVDFYIRVQVLNHLANVTR